MKKFSKLFWVALVVVAVLACTAIGIFAADTTETTNAVVYGDFVDLTEVGDSFEVGFHFKENDTLVECGKITLTWDSNKMTAESIVAANALNGAQFGSKIENGKAVIAWAGSSISDGTATGTLFTVNFVNKGIANDGFAVIETEVDNFGYTEGFVAKELKSTVTPCSAYAMGEELKDFTYTSDTTETPAQFLEAALAQAATTKEDVTVLISSEMEFTEDVTIGEGSYVEEAGTVYVTSVVDSEGNPVKGYTADRPADNTGIKIYADVIVNIYGKMNFNNVNIGNTQYKHGVTPADVEEFKAGTGMQSYSSGGCLMFAEGLGTFGLAENQTPEAETPNYGYVGVYPDENAYKVVTVTEGEGESEVKTEVLQKYTNKYNPHVAGRVAVYTGSYHTISGNYYKSGVGIDNPNVVVKGNAKSYYVMGGAHNGDKDTNPVTGDITLTIGGYADVTEASVGSWYSNTNQIGGIGTVTDNAKVGIMTAGFVGSGTIDEGKQYTLTVDSANVQIGTLSGHRFNAEGTATTNVKTTISAGKFQNIYGGFYAPWSYKSGSTKHNEFNGATELEITGNIYNYTVEEPNSQWVSIAGGSDMRHPGDIHAAETTLKISNITGTTDKDSLGIYGGSKMNSNSTGSDHSGITHITLTNVSLTHRTKNDSLGIKANGSWALLSGGSSIDSASTHSGSVDITLTGYNSTKRTIGGSYLNHAGAVHSGDTVVTIKSASKDYTGEIVGGSICYIANSTHSGNSTVELDSPDKTEANSFNCTPYGGSILNAQGTSHTGLSEVALKGGIVYKVVYGGSQMRHPRTVQTGDSKVSSTSEHGSEVTSLRNSVYGGSTLSEAFLIADNPDTTDKVETHYPLPTDESEKGAYGHRANSSVALGTNVYHQNGSIYGGSYLSFDTEWIKQGYIIQGDKNTEYKTSIENTGARLYRSYLYGSAALGNGGYQYADSEVKITTSKTICVQRIAGAYLNNGAELIGDSSVKFDHKNTTIVFDSGTKSRQFIIAGGAYGSGTLTGNASLEIIGASAQIDFHQTGAYDLSGSVELVGGCLFTTADSLMDGDSSIKFDGLDVYTRTTGYSGKVDGKNTYNNTQTYVTRRVIGGCYGPGKMEGNSKLELLSDTNINWGQGDNVASSFEAIVTAGCYGTNDITTTKDTNTKIYGGIRQTGNVEYISNTSNMIDSHIAISGIKSNVDGNLTIKIGGTGKYTQNFSALGRDYYYSSITGDLKTYVSNGTFDFNFYNGGTGKYDSNVTPKIRITGDVGYNLVGGNAYLEISGGKFANNTTSGGIFTTGQLGAHGDSYLKFVGNAFDIQKVKYIYSSDWSDSLQVEPKEGARDILDLSLVTDLDEDYTNFTGLVASDDTAPVLGYSSERGFSVVYPSLYDASTIAVTLKDKDVYPGAVLEDADDLEITYANSITAHNGTSADSVPTNSFIGTVATLCEYDDWASGEAAKTINAFKFTDTATSVEFTDVPVNPLEFTTTKMTVKAGNATSAELTVAHGLRVNGAGLSLGESVSMYMTIKSKLLDYYTDPHLVVVLNGVETDITRKELSGADKYEYIFDGMKPYLMDQTMDLMVKAKRDGVEYTSQITEYGVWRYAYNQATKASTRDSLKTLIADLLLYGDAVQKDKALKDSNYTYEMLATEKAALPEGFIETWASATPTLSDDRQKELEVHENPEVKIKGIQLSLGDTIKAEYRFIPVEGSTLTNFSDLTVKFTMTDVNGTPILDDSGNPTEIIVPTVPATDSTGGFWVTFPLKAFQLKDNYRFAVYRGEEVISNTLLDKVENYCEQQVEKADSEPTEARVSLANLCNAIMNYGESVKADRTAQG